MVQAGVYAGVTHYLKAVEALKSGADGKAVVAKMKEMPTDDPLFGKGTIRADGRKIHDAYLFEVKKPGGVEGSVATSTRCAPRSRRTRRSVRSRTAAARWSAADHAADVARGGRACAAPGRSLRRDRDVRNLRHPLAGAVRPALDRADQRLVLRAAEPRARRDLRHAQHHQFHARRPVHDGRLRGVPAAAVHRPRLLVGA